MKRQFDPAVPELMDRPQPVSRELEIDLHNLRQLNRYFGSHALVRRFLHRWINSGDMLRVLDLATGSGDIRIRTTTGDLNLANNVSAGSGASNAALVATAGNASEIGGIVTAAGLIVNASGAVTFDGNNAVIALFFAFLADLFSLDDTNRAATQGASGESGLIHQDENVDRIAVAG